MEPKKITVILQFSTEPLNIPDNSIKYSTIKRWWKNDSNTINLLLQKFVINSVDINHILRFFCFFFLYIIIIIQFNVPFKIIGAHMRLANQ